MGRYPRATQSDLRLEIGDLRKDQSDNGAAFNVQRPTPNAHSQSSTINSQLWLAQTWALLRKDLRAELRTKVALSAVGIFTFASLLLLGLATAGLKEIVIETGGVLRPAWDAQAKMGMLWVLLCFAAF